MVKNDHLVVKKYLNEHSLVESNVISFNNFLEHQVQEIVGDIQSTINNEDFEIKLGKMEIGKPIVIEADGSHSLLTPAEARVFNNNIFAMIS